MVVIHMWFFPNVFTSSAASTGNIISPSIGVCGHVPPVSQTDSDCVKVVEPSMQQVHPSGVTCCTQDGVR